MAEVRTFKRLKRTLSDCYNAIKAFNVEQTHLEECIAQMTILEETYKECIQLEKTATISEENDKLLDDLYTLHNGARKRVLAINHQLKNKSVDPNTTASFSELFENQSMILKNLLESTRRDEFQTPGPKIPFLTGENYAEFQSFRNLFDSLVHNNDNIPKVRKLQILKGLCKDKAYNLIRHVEIAENNYESTLALLNERFGRTKQVLTSYVKRFLEQPNISNPSAAEFHRIYDTSMEILNGIKTMGNNAESRDPWLILLLLNKLDSHTRLAWATETNGVEFPTIEDLLKFVGKRGNNMEVSYTSSLKPSTSRSASTKIMQVSSNISKNCQLCGLSHNLYECKEFLNMSVQERRSFVANKHRCFNCLSNGHQALNCKSKHSCKQCRRKHHSTLHEDDIQPSSSTQLAVNDFDELGESSQICLSSSKKVNMQAILPTVQVLVNDAHGQCQILRALIDSGAQNSLITEKCIKSLAIPRKNTNIHISGISGHTFKAKGIANFTIKSMHSPQHSINISALIVPKLPSVKPLKKEFVAENFKNLSLADPDLIKSGDCDLLIGADKCFSIIQPDQQISQSGVLAQNTIFGWVIVGGSALDSDKEVSVHSTQIEQDDQIEDILKRFWHIEERESPSQISPNDALMEKFFINNTSYKNNRFTTKLPFKPDAEILGDSYQIAKRRFLAIEKKMQGDLSFKESYTKGIHELIIQGHMKLTPQAEINTISEKYFLPHHPVYKIERETTKLRIVFDGSCKTTNGVSLNDKLLVGPVVQPSLWEILMRFRLHRIALTADIQKMYLQIQIHESDQRYQRILWRENPNDDLKQYQLTTVTFGLASSPFLATRALMQIAKDHTNEIQISNEIKRAFYVDDYISGADSEDQAMNIKEKLTAILNLYGFPLHKWKSNSKKVCDISNDVQTFENASTKILGLEWNPNIDTFLFNVQLQESDKLTKRILLSESAKVYDPLGWLAPTIILFKIIYQKLWIMKIDWDESLPREIASDYKIIREELPLFKNLQFPRHLQLNQTTRLHGFSDASERAYGAVIYARTIHQNSIYTILITSKSKVAPVKPTSIARLELCAAQLLSKLMSNTRKTLQITTEPSMWTDSKVVLAWLSQHPSHWKQFVANRCVQIQEEFPRKVWSYVSTKENPADYVSRGVKPSNLINLKQWWFGPAWLSDVNIIEEKHDPPPDSILEKERKQTKLHVLSIQQQEDCVIGSLFKKFRTFEKIRRILAYSILFITKLKGKRLSTTPNLVDCINEATNKIIIWAQKTPFAQEIRELKKNGNVNAKSSIASLYPFLDKNGILRVGGRLQNANINYMQKHPAIIPKNHELSKRLIWHYHTKNLHCGPSLTLQIIQQQFWLIHGRSLIRHELRGCVNCFKHKPVTIQQLMGQLPSPRITLTRAFHNSGIDYAGPLEIASKPGRGSKIIKGFIAIFVCMSTKAVHLEAVSDLTTSAFLAALTRFISRRGIPHTIHTDNARNFIGAKNRLTEVYKLVTGNNFNSQVSKNLSDQGINWKFITPIAPHEGGLWEAAVKQVKSLLLKTTQGHRCTMEELSTLLCKIESILNSRPLCKKFSDDVEENVLTPNHFLNGTASNLVIEEELSHIPQNRLDRWRIIQQQTQYFWHRYNKEYINTLHQRAKWHEPSNNINVGDIVLLKNEQLPSYKWPIAKIIELYPDTDGKVRQVSLKTSSSIFKRSVRQLCKLPIG